MIPAWSLLLLIANTCLAIVQAPALGGAQAISASDRVYTADQSSNTITVINPVTNVVLGTIALGDPRLTNVLGPQYIKQIAVHGLGFSRDGQFICVVSTTSSQLTVIRTQDNSIVSVTNVGRAAHEAFFAADNKQVWVAARGLKEVQIVDALKGGIIAKIDTDDGPSKVLFSPDGRTAYVNHIRSPTIAVIDVASRRITSRITGLSDIFSSDMMISADGKVIWTAHKLVGRVSVVDVDNRKVTSVLETGPETNHPNFVVIGGQTFAWITVASRDETLVYRQDSPQKQPVFIGSAKSSGSEPHGLWPSPDNTRMFVLNEHSDSVDVFDTRSLKLLNTLLVGQEGQGLAYVAGAVTSGNGTQNLGTQGLNRKVENAFVPVVDEPNGSALITVRSTDGLDQFQLIARNLQQNTSYTAFVTLRGQDIPLFDFRATLIQADGCATAPQVLAFFKFFGVYDLKNVFVRQTTA